MTPATSPLPSRNPSTPSLASQNSNKSATETVTGDSSKGGSSFFGRWGFSGSSQSQLQVPKPTTQPEGPVEELVVSGAAFGTLTYSHIKGETDLVLSRLRVIQSCIFPTSRKSKVRINIFGFWVPRLKSPFIKNYCRFSRLSTWPTTCPASTRRLCSPQRCTCCICWVCYPDIRDYKLRESL